jgi:hypothetical protein
MPRPPRLCFDAGVSPLAMGQDIFLYDFGKPQP